MEKQVIPQITITRMQIGEFEVPVPHGLNELLNAAGAWGKPQKEKPSFLKDYHRKVEMRDGRIFTVLTKKRKGLNYDTSYF
ncbi:hypothetical protein AWH56_005420 [Anaerobacillus isosaccharinicus]|uniref:Uncharacterized protein n=1 Tax=Anaerobacillus isosaccharinicus TaxID=1532552 RepID=A0A1S2M8I1_9BACI|nr:hypothetical protein [Anaerobacillus isosaccharinicus]MBA5584535.1 hypothetical protein [Anaerobacillus isosaccharinicus]QOY37082.1 hypothetical protein AWH56_005420 [Anaerobacillus isosaccharinicus]